MVLRFLKFQVVMRLRCALPSRLFCKLKNSNKGGNELRCASYATLKPSVR